MEDVCDVYQLFELAFRVFGSNSGDVTVVWPVHRLPSRQPQLANRAPSDMPLDDVSSNAPEIADPASDRDYLSACFSCYWVGGRRHTLMP